MLWKSASTKPAATQMSVKRNAAVIPTGKPTPRAVSDRSATPRRLSTIATQSPARVNSGPTTIAPIIKIVEPVKMPTDAIRQASAMKARKVPPSSVVECVRALTSSQTTASEGIPFAARSARRAASEIWESICSSVIEPSL